MVEDAPESMMGIELDPDWDRSVELAMIDESDRLGVGVLSVERIMSVGLGIESDWLGVEGKSVELKALEDSD